MGRLRALLYKPMHELTHRLWRRGKGVVGFTLGVLSVLGCTPRSHVAYRSATQEAQNEAIAARAAGKELANSKSVRVFIDETPKGIVMQGDRITIEPGYAHRVLGSFRIYTVGQGLGFEEVPRVRVVALMKNLAAAAGGDGVVASYRPPAFGISVDSPSAMLGYVVQLDPRMLPRY